MDAITIFCEEVRKEIGDTETIVGVMPDTIVVESLPFIFPKFAAYTRIRVTSIQSIKDIRFELRNTDGSILIEQDIPTAELKDLFSRNPDADAAGVRSVMAVQPLPVEHEGRLEMHLYSTDQSRIIGSFRIVCAPSSESSDKEIDATTN